MASTMLGYFLGGGIGTGLLLPHGIADYLGAKMEHSLGVPSQLVNEAPDLFPYDPALLQMEQEALQAYDLSLRDERWLEALFGGYRS